MLPVKKSITLKTIFSSLLLLLYITQTNAQEYKETVQPLTAKSMKGYVYDISKDAAGNSNITYKMKLDKKSEDISFEKYSFDKDIKFISTTDVQETKEQKADIERTYLYAYVGGTSSFDVNSMKLKLSKVVKLITWNHEKQTYIFKKTISSESVKPKNDAGKVYYGFASYNSEDAAKNDVFIIAKTESKIKTEADKFFILMLNDKLELTETPLDLNGSYTLVFCEQVKNENVVMILAPKEGAADATKYVYYQFDITGKLIDKVTFNSPASALLVTAAIEKEGNIYFCGSSTKTNEPYEEVFKEYGPIYNPGNTPGGNNLMDIKWRKGLDEKMENFHLLKFSGSKMEFASTTPVKDFKTKFKTAPDDKGASSYTGKQFFIETFSITAAEEYLIAGQLKGSVSMGTGVSADSYEDIVCFHFDKTGNLKAQFGIGKMNSDKKSEIFAMTQRFYPSSDGKSMYWELMEVKGTKGYEDFVSAYLGVPKFYPLYYPRIVKIDLGASSMGAVKVMGEEKYFLRRDFTSKFDKSENSITYVGHDEDWKKIWLGKVLLN